MLFRSRPYNPESGRFVQQDPLSIVTATNAYAYVENDPDNLTDPSGLSPNPDPNLVKYLNYNELLRYTTESYIHYLCETIKYVTLWGILEEVEFLKIADKIVSRTTKILGINMLDKYAETIDKKLCPPPEPPHYLPQPVPAPTPLASLKLKFRPAVPFRVNVPWRTDSVI